MTAHCKPLVIPIFIPHAGCPHHCIFCNQTTVTGTAARMPTSADIYSEIQRFLQYRKPHRNRAEVSFYGGNFLGIQPEKIHELLSATLPFIEDGTVDGLRFSTRPDTIDAHRLALLADYPVSTVEIGVQSMSDAILKTAGRGHTAEDTVRAVGLLRQKTYRIGLQMMVGLPGDDFAATMATGRAIAALSPDFVRIYPTLVLEGSALAELYRKSRYVPLPISECIDRVKTLYRLFSGAGIAVTRMGLQASTELDSGTTVLAGPYHPALGHMVLSDLLLDRAVAQIEARKTLAGPIVLYVHPRSISRMRGLKNRNIAVIKKRFGIDAIRVKADPAIGADDVVVSSAYRALSSR